MGHLCMVDKVTYPRMTEAGAVLIRSTLGANHLVSAMDLFADAVAVREGDWIFPWSFGASGWGFKHAFQVASGPVFVHGAEFPIQIPLKDQGFEFEKPVREAVALDLWRPRLLWNAIGKKSLGVGRSLTHQTRGEDVVLLALLSGEGPRSGARIAIGPWELPPGAVPLRVDPGRREWTEGLEAWVNAVPGQDRLSVLKPDAIPIATDDGRFRYEKGLEGWILQSIDREEGRELRECTLALGDVKPKWFGNYLPFGVAGSHIDVVTLQRKPQGKEPHWSLTITELKKDRLGVRQWLAAAYQAVGYAEFIATAFDRFGMKVDVSVSVVGGRPRSAPPSLSPISTPAGRFPVRWASYEVTPAGEVRFESH